LAPLLLSSLALAQDPPLPRKLGEFTLRVAAFVEAYPKTDFTGDDRDKYTLYMTTFDAGE